MSEGQSAVDPATHELLDQLQARVDATGTSRKRVHALLEAVLSVGRELEVQQVLRRIVEAAVFLVDAEYGALGVIGEDRMLSEFIPVGVDDETWAAIGALPTGHGLLGELVRHPEPLRLHELSEHPAFRGFPPNHPPMHSFLGVPVRVRGQVFGNLYLTEKRGTADFDEEDEAVLMTLAVAAGVAIENSRLFERSCLRERWLASGSEVTNSLLSGSPRAEVMALILDHAHKNVAADLGLIAVPVEGADRLRIALAAGADSDRYHGEFVPLREEYLGRAFAEAAAAVSLDIEHDPRSGADSARWAGFGPAMAVPLGSGTTDPRGVLLLARSRRSSAFSADAFASLKTFTRQASLAMELAERRKDAVQLALLEDRDRIARDLHDLAIQRLFATGMTLQGALRFVTHPQAEQRLRRAVDDLDTTIKIIRSTIFGLRSQQDSVLRQGLRSRVAQAVEAATGPLGFAPALRVEGLVESRVPVALADHVVAVLVEALSNASRYARATAVDVHLTVTADRTTLTLTDDGVGIPANARFSGIRNMRDRARMAGGELRISTPPGGGTRLTWSAPSAESV
ncbi:GAF domain-containing sensor histidine kinase [Streptomyces sp. JH34]|uniref:sensor histidine kinase n=1 Tax=Streptomyces sp. JH34 TaxID=2793633 RepID=UPI0023F80D5F|nr:GAF domain-containing sensor histidine kinase [Streptomyces sp. JH34]MDF6022474.1 GAF domain-containing sensor histidine kinase [Streptomyces sp. JH34]